MAERKTFYFSDGPYLQTLKGLYGALSVPEAFIKLMGNARTGKSALCEKLCQFLRRKGYRVVYLKSAIESPEMLRSVLARELDLPDSQNFARLLEDAFADDTDKPVIFIFDDAHLLTDITLIEIYRLAEVQVGTSRAINIVLCGEPSLEKRLLSNKEFRSLLLNVSHKFLLEPMDADTLSRFLLSYLEKAGMGDVVIEPAALTYFFKSCKGYPGPAAILCRLMVESRIGETQQDPITKQELVKLVKDSAGVETLPSQAYRDTNPYMILGPMAAVLVIASIAYLFQQLSSSEPQLTSPELALQSEGLSEGLSEVQPENPIVEASPFSEQTIEEELVASVAPEIDESVVTAINEPIEEEVISFSPVIQVGAAVQDEALLEESLEEESVSDSSLALVTAAERGVAEEEIVVPQYEELAESVIEPQPEEVLEETALANVIEEIDEELVELEPETTEDPEQLPELALQESPEPVLLASSEPIEEPADISSNPEPALTEAAVEEAVISEALVIENQVAEIEPELDPESVPLEQAVEIAVDSWILAWQSQSLEDYFASYHSNFESRYQDTRAAWQRNRERVIGGADWIRLQKSDYRLVAEESGIVEVQFWIDYESPSYRDETQKKLLLANEDGQWRILEEINLQVRS